jgi:hypothetical protein
MKKIKSVRLLKGLPGFPKGTYLIDLGIGLWSFDKHNNVRYSTHFMDNNPDFFEIEYEQERKYIDVRISCESQYLLYEADGFETILKSNAYIPTLKVTKLGEGTL